VTSGLLAAVTALGLTLVMSGAVPPASADENKPSEKPRAGSILDPVVGRHLKAAVADLQDQHYAEAETELAAREDAAKAQRTKNVGSAPASRNVLVNGDFSRGELRHNWTALYAGSEAIVGWRVTRPVDYVSSAYWQTADAPRSIDLDGTPGPGSIEQTFSTVAGDPYAVRFKIGANTEGPPRVKRVRVTVGGTTRRYSIDVSGRSNAAMHYAQAAFTFVAPARTATLLAAPAGAVTARPCRASTCDRSAQRR